MDIPTCRHIKTNGERCRAFALNTRNFCYFHDRILDRHRTYRRTPAKRTALQTQGLLQLDALEDRDAVQIAVSQVINAIAVGALDLNRAKLILTGLRIASINATLRPAPTDTVRAIATQDDGIDLAEPGHDGKYSSLASHLAAKNAAAALRPAEPIPTPNPEQPGCPTSRL